MRINPYFFMASFYSIAMLALAVIAQPSMAISEEKMPTEPTTENKATIQETAIFAGGCFWCIESVFDYTEGVSEAVSGYIGGTEESANYSAVGAGKSGHAEAVRVTYDPTVISYNALLKLFWENIDPLDSGGQFADRGSQYRTALFVLNDEQRAQAEASIAATEKRLGQKVATTIETADSFYPAEEYHQNYQKENPLRYKLYYHGSGRPDRLKQVWGSDK